MMLLWLNLPTFMTNVHYNYTFQRLRKLAILAVQSSATVVFKKLDFVALR